MATRFMLCLVYLCAITTYVECGRSFGQSSFGASYGSRSSSSNWGRSWGSSSASIPKYPSSSSGLFGYRSSAPTYPSSSSGLSGYGSSAPKYTSSSSGLSGYGSSAPKYPSSSSGLSGYGNSAPKNPGSSLPKYPSSSSGLSGSGSSLPKYPSSSSGLSGLGNANKPYGTRNFYINKRGYESRIPSYYNAPQLVYITAYRDSGSRYGDLLAGLALYNLGRSHHQYHDHFYSDDYYRRRYYTSGSTSTSYEKPKDEVYCTLRVKENEKIEILKIPCEIVSTFTEGSKKITSDKLTKAVCVSNNTNTINRVTDSSVKNVFTTMPSLAFNKESTMNNNVTHSLPGKMYQHTDTSVSDYSNLGSFLSSLRAYPLPQGSKYVLINNKLTIITATARTTNIPVNISSISKDSTLQNFTINSVTSSNVANEDVTLATQGINLINVTQTEANNLSVTTSQNSTLNTVTNNTLINVTQTEATKTLTNPVLSVPTNILNTTTNVNMSTSVPQLLGSDKSTYTIVPNVTTIKPETITNNTPSSVITLNITTSNSTTCTETKDPLTAKGPPVNVRDMECEVDIITKDSHVLRSKVDCSTLLQYAKMPEPKKGSNAILPPRNKLKSWLSNPPWWMSLFIAV